MNTRPTRPVGNTGMQATVVGLGCEHLIKKTYEEVDDVISAAIDNGINILDIFMPGAEVRGQIGRSLRGRRDKVLIHGHIGSCDVREQFGQTRDLGECRQYFEELLQHLETDYIDFGMLHFMDTHDHIDLMLKNGVVEYARQLKKSGKIRAIGASSHNPETARRLVEEDMVEMLLFSINPAYDMMPDFGDIEKMMSDGYADHTSGVDPERAELYRLCQNKGVGITVMKSLCAGKLLSAEQSIFTQALSPVQCIHYALTRPAVASVIVGCETREEVEASAKYFEAAETEKDFSETISRVKDGVKSGFKGNCVYCGHCQPCPANINVAQIIKCLDIACLNEKEISPGVIQQYNSLTERASNCLQCGDCEGRCPFSVPVMQKLDKAAQLFGS